MQEPRLTIFSVAVMMDPSGVNPFSATIPLTNGRNPINYTRMSRRTAHIGRAYSELLDGRPAWSFGLAVDGPSNTSTSSKFIFEFSSITAS